LQQYGVEDLLRLAKRVHNTKRTYLLVDPLQGKHMPVSPSAALDMMGALGARVRAACPDTGLVIGFAETATAVGFAVAQAFGRDCVYVHTTRETLPRSEAAVEFLEEHSHATEQALASSRLDAWLARTDAVVFVDDEISTGRTLANFIRELDGRFPALRGKRRIAASIINRMAAEQEEALAGMGVECVCLLRLRQEDLTQAVVRFDIRGAEAPALPTRRAAFTLLEGLPALPDARRGVRVGGYDGACRAFAAAAIGEIDLTACVSALVLGTEECMYPAMCLGARLERERGLRVRTHSTTRSPIGLCGDAGYPITSGARLTSFYDTARATYLYDIAAYDLVVVVTDSAHIPESALQDLADALSNAGNARLCLARG